jgi:transposase
MGRLSSYAKNRILKLRFKKNKRIIHIVDILKNEDNIKVSRQAVSTFLKKYLETNSIYDKPRTGRKRKLTQEEIQLIGQVTRLNRDITARAIKEYLNLNVSTYTILRATKLFEWNKVNPNSNDSKKAAAIERQLNGSGESTGFEGTEDEVLVPGEISLVVRPASPSSAAVADNSQTINTTAEAAQIDEQQQNGKRKKTGRRAGANQSRIGRKYKKRKGAAGDGEENGGGGETVSELENAGFSGGGFTAEDEDDDDEEVEKIQLKPLVDQEMKKVRIEE